MVFKIMYDREYLDYSQIFLVLLCGTAVLWLRTLFLMPKEGTIPYPVPTGYYYGIGEWMESVPCKSEDQKIHGILNDFLQRKERAGSSASQISEIFDQSGQPKSFRDQLRGSWEHIRSTSFISFNIWFIACNLRHVFFVSSVNAWLGRMPEADCDYVSEWTNFFGGAQFFGFLFAPMAGLLIDGLENYFERDSIGIARRLSYVTSCGVSLVITSILGIIFTVTALNEQIAATLILEVVFRAFLYGCHATFITLLFPADYFGFLYGTSFFIGGATGFLAIPLFGMVMGLFQGDFIIINWFFIVLIGVSTIWTAIIHIKWI
jgi:hypothetical protein